jgi:hypothetical protein
MIVQITEDLILNTETNSLWSRTRTNVVPTGIESEVETRTETVSCSDAEIADLEGREAESAWSVLSLLARMHYRIFDGEYAAVMERERMLRQNRYGNRSGRIRG